MNYQKIHDNLINFARITSPINSKKRDFDVYMERHHIIPKCLFEHKDDPYKNNKNNLIFLTPRQHFIVHKILTKIYPDNIKIWYAFSRMFHETDLKLKATDLGYMKSVSKSYDTFRRLFNEKIKEYYSKNPHPNKGRKLSETAIKNMTIAARLRATYPSPLKGRKSSPEAVAKMKETKKLNPYHPTEEVNNRRSESLKLRHKIDPSWKEKIRDHMKGKVRTESTITKFIDSKSKLWLITTPENESFVIKNLNQFCKNNNLHTGHMTMVSTGKLKQHKGYLCSKIDSVMNIPENVDKNIIDMSLSRKSK